MAHGALNYLLALVIKFFDEDYNHDHCYDDGYGK